MSNSLLVSSPVVVDMRPNVRLLVARLEAGGDGVNRGNLCCLSHGFCGGKWRKTKDEAENGVDGAHGSYIVPAFG